MGSVTIKHRVNHAAIAVMFKKSSGGLTKTMAKRAVRVQKLARANLARSPRRIDTGRLQLSIGVQPILYRGYPAYRIGSSLDYARYVHDGTGLYGPKHHYIVPRHGKYLVFTPKGELVAVFAKRVKGMRPNPFLADALVAARL